MRQQCNCMPQAPWEPPDVRPIDRTQRTRRTPVRLAFWAFAAATLAAPFITVPTPAARATGPVNRIERDFISVTPSTTVAKPAKTTTVINSMTTTTTGPSASSPAPSTNQGPQSASTTATSNATVPAPGHATADGCGPALAYLAAYAAPGFQLVCPGNAQGHQATTCFGTDPCAPGQGLIIISDPCPAAYMNEAANSWAILHGGVIDPFGACRS